MERELKEKHLVALKFAKELPEAENDLKESIASAITRLTNTGSLKKHFPEAWQAISQLKVSFRYDSSQCLILADVSFKDVELAKDVAVFTVNIPSGEFFRLADISISLNSKEVEKLARIILDHLLWLVHETSREKR